MTDTSKDVVERFNPVDYAGCRGYMKIFGDGRWVRASDYDALAAKLDAFEARIRSALEPADPLDDDLTIAYLVGVHDERAQNPLDHPKVKALVEVVEWYEGRRLDAIARAESIHAPEDAAVLALCKKHGYGAVIDSACRQWASIQEGGSGAFFVGGCIGDTAARAALAALEKPNET